MNRISLGVLPLLLLAATDMSAQSRSSVAVVEPAVQWVSLGAFGPEPGGITQADPTVAVASGAGHTLALWSERVGGVSRIGLWSDGAPERLILSPEGEEALRPAAAFGEDAFLVSWLVREDSETGMRVAVVDAQSGALASEPFDLATCHARRASLAYGNGSFLVVWQETLPSGAAEIVGQMVSAAGQPIGARLEISQAGSDPDDGLLDAVSPAVAFDRVGGEFLVAWSANGNESATAPAHYRIMTRKILGDGTFGGAQATEVLDAGASLHEPRLAWSGTSGQWYMTWTRQEAGSPLSVRGFLKREGAREANRPVNLGIDGEAALHAEVAPTPGGEFQVVWESAGRVLQRLVDAGGTPGPVEVLGAGRRPVVSSASGQVMWSQPGAGIAVASPAGASPVALEVPEGTVLAEAYPNPFVGVATLRLAFPDAQHVDVVMFDLLGRQVRSVFSGSVEANRALDLTVEGDGLPSGTYLIQIQGRDQQKNLQLVLVR